MSLHDSAARPRFGTDGLRGVANTELTPELTLALGRAAAVVLGTTGGLSGQHFLVGRDTRRSGPLLFAALAAGLASQGATVVDLGVLPTPGVAWESAAANVPAAMISASHNPFADNGIKFFSAGGRKLPDAVESAIETELDAYLSATATNSRGTDVGVVIDGTSACDGYGHHVIGSLEGRRLDGLSVVIDCANGAASIVAPDVLRRLGARVEVLHAEPNGVNINELCGSTHPQSLQAAVVASGAHVGLAFDGDADRMLAVDAAGELVDGDQIMAAVALDMRAQGQLRDDTVVVTVMSNLGFKLAMASAGLRVVETKVGDRYVLEALEAGGYSLGGEQSGHLIFRDQATTGDGLLSGVTLLDLMLRSGKSLASLVSVMTRLPQVLKNVKGVDRARLDSEVLLWDDVRAVESQLGGHGRVLLRPSGTEALVRVMVEAPTVAIAEAACDRLCATVQRTLG